eukprot:12885057-Prorocentrum_lima.AAC.1
MIPRQWNTEAGHPIQFFGCLLLTRNFWANFWIWSFAWWLEVVECAMKPSRSTGPGGCLKLL